MTSIPQVSEAMRTLLTEQATALERPTRFVQRSTAQVDGAVFVQTLVFGLLANPTASYSQLAHVSASLGVPVSKQALEQRMGEGSVALLRHVLEQGAAAVIASDARAPHLLSRFNGVYLQDGSTISVPASLAEQWPGTGGGHPPAGKGCVQLQVRLNLSQGEWAGLWLQSGRERETTGAPASAPLPVGSLWDVDSGYRNLSQLRELGNSGRYWIMPPSADLLFVDPLGVRRSLKELVERQHCDRIDLEVKVGAKEELPVRLIAVRVSQQKAKRRRQGARGQTSTPPKGTRRPNARKRLPPSSTGKRNRHGDRHHRLRRPSKKRMELLDWTIVMTNVPREMASLQEILVLHRCRWQIELLWKLSKEIQKVDTWRSEKPARILTEIFAKWLGLLISHWVMLIDCWQDPRHSTVKAHQVMQWMAPVLAVSLTGLLCLEQAVAASSAAMRRGCRIDPRRKRPATFQLLDDPSSISP